MSGGFDVGIASASFTASTEFEKVKNETRTTKTVRVRAYSQCEAYELKMGSFITPPLSEDFKAGIQHNIVTTGHNLFIFLEPIMCLILLLEEEQVKTQFMTTKRLKNLQVKGLVLHMNHRPLLRKYLVA